MTQEIKKVYAAISNVSSELLTGIAKDGVNQMQRFNFRGIDSVYNALAPALVKHKLIIAPRIVHREVTERATKNGGALFYVVVKAEFDFISTEDGSIYTATNYGEAMDSSDKATNKAMSIAYKYAAFQTFCIPTEDTSHDPEAEHYDVAPESIEKELNEINGAVNVKELQEVFGRAWKATSLVENKAELKDAYDKKKASLEEGENASQNQMQPTS